MNDSGKRDYVAIRKKPSFRTNPAERDEIRNPAAPPGPRLRDRLSVHNKVDDLTFLDIN